MAGLYIHIPFASHPSVCREGYVVAPPLLYEPFVDVLLLEMEHVAGRYAGQAHIDTVHLSGGTPSVLPPKAVFRILDAVARLFTRSATPEITFDVSPAHGTADYLEALHDAGVNRLSVDVQSFFDEDLHRLMVPYTAAQARAVLETARRAGFEDLSVNLAFGLPGQPEEYEAANLERVVAEAVPHLATFGLTATEAALLRRNAGFSDEELDMRADPGRRYTFAVAYLQDHGYDQYEQAHFARPGHACRHFLNAWHHENMLGLGPSAHSLWCQGLPKPATYIWSNIPDVDRYQRMMHQGTLPIDNRYVTTLDALTEDYIMMQLRTTAGLNLDDLEARFGYDLLLERIDALAHLEAEGYIHPVRNSHVRLTPAGRFEAAHALEALLP